MDVVFPLVSLQCFPITYWFHFTLITGTYHCVYYTMFLSHVLLFLIFACLHTPSFPSQAYSCLPYVDSLLRANAHCHTRLCISAYWLCVILFLVVSLTFHV